MPRILFNDKPRAMHPNLQGFMGQFIPGLIALAASKAAWTKTGGGTSGFDVTLTAPAGLAGSSTTLALTAGGGPACQGTAVGAHFDPTLQTIDGETGWSLFLIPHSTTGLGIVVHQNNTAKVLTVLYEPGVSTRALVNAAIAAQSTKVCVVAAGVATGAIAASEMESVVLHDSPQECAVVSGVAIEAFFTNAASTNALVKAALLAVPAIVALAVASGGTGTTTLLTADHFAATALAGGRDAIAATVSKGKGFSVANVSVGLWLVTADQAFKQPLDIIATLEAATALALDAQVGPAAGSSKSVYVRLVLAATGAVTDPTYASTTKINLFAAAQP
jgi:hypothetical protein